MNALQFLISQNFDLVAAGTTIVAIAVLGVSILLADRQSITNKTFFLFSLATIAYAVVNFLSYRISDEDLTIWFLRGTIFFATFHALLFFQLFYVFPKSKATFPGWYKYCLLPLACAVALLTLTPLVFNQVKSFPSNGHPAVAVLGPAIGVFGFTAALFVIAALLILARKSWRAQGIEKEQFRLVALGSVTTFAGLLILNVILPLVFENVLFITLAPVVFFPFLGLTAYAIGRYRLFNIKLVAIALLSFLLAVTIISQVIFSTTLGQVLFGVTQFALVVIFSLWLLRATMREVEQRELIESQRAELERMNNQQERFLHFISHEVKGYLTDGQNAFAAIVEGDLGKVAPQVWNTSTTALAKMREGVHTVMDILAASNMKAGTVTYKKEPFDFHETFENAIEIMRPRVAEKGLKFDVSVVEGNYTFIGDKEKIEHHVIRNLVDNAIRYTPQGSITIALERDSGHIRFAVKDTGVGITEEDKPRLFTEGGHGKDSIKVNVNSTGYGLYVAKQVIEAHGGTIRAESAGAGKGAEFIVELPVSS